MSNISQIRKPVLPEDVFKLIEGYMMGDIVALHIVAVSRDRRTMQVSAGQVPQFIAKNDSNIGEELRKIGK